MTDLTEKRVWGPQPRYPEVLTTEKGDQFKDMIVIAGPCSVESASQISRIVPSLADAGVTFARGGVYRAGTYPPKDFGLKSELLSRWARDVHKAGLKTVVEILDIRQVESIEQYADAFQVGARHCQDYALLVELAQSKKTIAIKRNPGMTLDEFLGAAEYLTRGRCTPILIERGSATHMNHVRWDLSISLIAAVKRMTGLPILVDASHGTGRRDLVEPMIMAGMAAGADGFLIEVHPEPENSISDADQAVPLDRLFDITRRARTVQMAVES